MKKNLLGSLLLLTTLSVSQAPVFAQKVNRKVVKQMTRDLTYLASDELEGRMTGSKGEALAVKYVIDRYKSLGIGGYNGGEYIQPFFFNYGKELAKDVQLTINGQALELGKEYDVMAFSGTGEWQGDNVALLEEEGNVWVLPIYSNEDEAKDVHFDWEKHLFELATKAQNAGAVAVVFYENMANKHGISFNSRSHMENIAIPVVVIKQSIALGERYNLDATNTYHIKTGVNPIEWKSNNVVAVLNNNAPYTIVVGAHIDHIGYGELSSRSTDGKGQIHNGADDNASGSAALLQVAKWLKANNNKAYNYMFIHFSAEEMGLFGSKGVVANLGLDSSKIAMMFNMDMVGRLNPADKGLTIGGIGTSPSFSKAVELANANKFKINIDSSGMGPSDHSSFYLKNIPVLFYFTGVHADYHKPSDDAHLINYKGMAKIAQLVTKTIHALANGPRPEFRQTAIKETKSVRFKVTLGVMPDYSYSGEGMKIDGVVEGKPAQSAGMKAGDIVTKIGDVDVKGMESYMQALAKYKKGDTVDVVYMRDGQQMIANITF